MPNRTVLEIARAATDVIGLDDLSSLVNNREPGARGMLRQLNRAGRTMARMRNSWGGTWTVLTREYAFRTRAGVDEYALPDDYEGLIDGTVWDRSTYREMRGTLSPQEWQQARSGLIQTVSIAPLYRIRRATNGMGKALFLEPVPARAEDLVFEYVSSGWLQSGSDPNRFIDQIEADTDRPLFDDEIMEENLIWRFKQSRGLTYAVELAEYEIEVNRVFAADTGPRTIVLGRGRWRQRWPNTPESGFGGMR